LGGEASDLRVRSVLFLSLGFLVVALVGLTVIYPSVDDLFVLNPFWNGLSELYALIGPVRLDALSDLVSMVIEYEESCLLLIGPSKPFTFEDADIIEYFLVNGGSVVLADDFGTGNDLLEKLGSKARFSHSLLQDQLFKDKNALMPEVSVGDFEVVLNYAGILEYVEDEGVSWSSSYSYISDTPVGFSDATSFGPFPVVAQISVGRGLLYLVSDSSPFINSMLERRDNKLFLQSMLHGRIFIDEGHSIPSRLTVVKAFLTSFRASLNAAEVRYGLTIIGVIAVFNIKPGEDIEEPAEEVEEVLKKHPEYDKWMLEDLYEARRRAG
jgi:hypothetical protein